MMTKELKWNVDIDSIKEKRCAKLHEDYMAARAQMEQRTHHHELYGLLAKNKSIHEWQTNKRGPSKYFSEGSTQYILRKVLADTIQRVPDGELKTQYDKNSVEHIEIEYLFKNKVMWSEFKGVDMLSNLTNTFKMAFIYAFAPVRTGFEKDNDDDARVSYNLESWADVFINPDCKDIRSAEVVYFRQYMTKAEVEGLIDENGNAKDPTYSADTIKYVLDHDMFSAKRWESEKLADKLKGSTSIASLTLVTEYRKGSKEFTTFVPELDAVFRKVPNYDPQGDIPWTFFVLEPDPDFPLGVSQVEFLLGDQQFNDLFQTSAYKNLLLAMEPPIMVSGWETNPSSYKFEPRRIWNLGNNPNQVKVDPVKIDNSVLSGWATTREAIASSMLRNLNVAEGTIAKDAGVGFSKTAPGVKAQQDAKTITINQYQKRLEYFIGDWANKALRTYLAAMGGVHSLTVDEETRRKLFDIDRMDLIDGNKAEIDFDALSSDMVSFTVRAGSLVQIKEDQERAALTELMQPFVQNLNGWSEDNRRVVENEVLLPIMKRMLELSDVDISQTMADSLGGQIAKAMMASMQAEIDTLANNQVSQQMQMDAMQGQMMPAPDAALDMGEGGLSPDSALPLPEEEPPAQQVTSGADLLPL